jgi:putative transposase
VNIEYTYKFRLYPNKNQEILLDKHFGSIRFVYNLFLDKRTKFYLEAKEKQLSKKTLTYIDCSKELTQIKQQKETEWLNEINSQSLQHSLKHLDGAFNSFFKKLAKYPRFKSKKNKQSFRIPQFISICSNKIYFPKFKEGIKIDQHREIDGEIKNATIIKNCAGQYYACVGVVKNIDPKPKLNKKPIAIDLGVKSLVVCSNGEKFENIKPLKQLQKLLKIRQQALSRSVKNSNGRIKSRLRVGKLHIKISNIRSDYLHKISSKLISENQTIILEDLDVNEMMMNKHQEERKTTRKEERNRHKNIGDCSWSELVRQINYKANWYGRKVIKIDRYFPSSKTCNKCGYINENLKLSDREWECPRCNSFLDRDYNASLNILRQGLNKLNLTTGIVGLAACPDVRPDSDIGRLVGAETLSFREG